MYSKKIIIMSFLIIFFIFQTAFAQTCARVNGTPVPCRYLDQAVNLFLFKLKDKRISRNDMAGIKRQLLENLIDQELILQESEKEDISVSTRELEKEFVKLRYQFRYNDNKIKITESELKDYIERGIIVKKFIDKVIAPAVKIYQKDLKDFYYENIKMFTEPEMVRARHILIKAAPSASEAEKKAAYNKLRDIRWKAFEGKNFASLARQYSECPSAARGGDLGYFSREKVVKPFADAAFSLKEGKISKIIETEFGYHIILLVDKKKPETVKLETVKKKIFKFVERHKIAQETKAYIKNLRKNSEIEIIL